MPSSLTRPDSASARFKVDVLLHFSVGSPLEALRRSVLLALKWQRAVFDLPAARANRGHAEDCSSRPERGQSAARFGAPRGARTGAREEQPFGPAGPPRRYGRGLGARPARRGCTRQETALA